MYWEAIDDLKGMFGADAANDSSDDTDDQEDALDDVEGEVSDSVSGAFDLAQLLLFCEESVEAALERINETTTNEKAQ
jgi:hypothetical protein